MKFTYRVFLLLTISNLICFFANAQTMQSLEVASNPSVVVRMGDAVTFSATAYNAGAALGSTELEIKVPVGWEIVSANPVLKPGSLAADKRTARVVVTMAAASNQQVDFHLKPLCGAVPEEGIITYNWHKESTLLATKNTQPIGNFIDPIIRFTAPSDQNDLVANQTLTRIWSVEQTAASSYINNLVVEASCNKTTLVLSKVEIVNSTGTTVLKDITSTALDAGQAGKYLIKLYGEDFKKVGNSNSKLETGEIIYIRETFTLTDCSSGNTSYRAAYGDGTSVCSYTSPLNVAAVIAQPGYNHDIMTVGTFAHVGENGENGKVTMRLYNNSTDALAKMYNVLVAVYNTDLSQVDYKRAYFSDDSGNAIAGLTDIPLVNSRAPHGHVKKWFVSFDRLPNVASNPTEKAKYEARGLSDLDGDGICDDLAPGKSVTITVEFSMNYDRVGTTGCATQILQNSSTRRGDLYYQNTCGVYQAYTRGYQAIGSTNTWMGEFKYSNPVVSLDNLNVTAGDNVVLTVKETAAGNGNIGYSLAHITLTTEHGVKLIIPQGFAYNPAVGIKVNGTSVAASDIKAINTREVGFRNRISVSSGKAYTIGITATSDNATDKTLRLEHTYKTALSSTVYRYGCYTKPISFEQVKDCSRLQMTSFNVERTTFGWTDANKTTKASKASGANVSVAGPYDNVKMAFTINVRSNISLAAGEKLYGEVTYDGNNSAGQPYFGEGQGATLRYKKNGSADFAAAVNIPTSSIIKDFTAGGKHSLKADLSPYIGSGKHIPALGAGDVVELVFLTQTTQYLPNAIAYVNNLAGQVYTTNTAACNGLMSSFRIVNYALGSAASGNNSATYNANQTGSHAVYRHWLASEVGAPGNYFPKEFRPNASLSNLTITLNSLVEVTALKLKNDSSSLVNPANYTVSHSNGSTTVHIKDPIKDEVFFNQWTGYNYFMEWNAICWSGQATTLKVKVWHFPTSERPRAEAEQDATFNSDLGITATNYSYTFTCDNASISPTDNRLEWDLTLTNRSVWANTDPNLPYSWVGVDIPAGITPVDLIDLSTNTSVGAPLAYSGGYWWKLGDQNLSDSKRYKLVCQYSSCTGSPVLKARYGMSKIAYPTDPQQGFTQYNSGLCGATIPVNLIFTPPTVDFSAGIREKGANTSGNFVFCDPITFEATFTNGTAAKVYNPQLKVKLPTGMEWVGNARVKLGAGSYVSLPASSISQSGNEVTVRLGTNMVLDSYQSGGNPNSIATLEFKLKTTCGFISGSAVYADFIGHNGCGTATIKNANSGNIDIEGISGQIPNYIVDVASMVATPFVETPGGKVTISGNIKLISANASPNDYIFIELPANLQLSSAGVAPNLVFEHAEATRIKAKLPASGTFLDTKNFSIELTPTNLALWNCSSYDILFKYGVEKELACVGAPGGACVIAGHGDNVVTKSFTIQKQQLALSEVIFSGKYKDSAKETITFSGKVSNPSASAANISLAVYLDNNGNGVFDAGDVPATGNPTITVSSIPAGGSKTFSNVFDIPATEICKLMIVAQKGASNPYLCENVVAKPAEVGYSLAQATKLICQGSNLTIGDLAITGYTYNWSSAYVTGNSLAQPVFNYPASEDIVGSTTAVNVPVTVTRPGGCSTTANVSVTVEALPVVTITAVTANEPNVAGTQGDIVFTLTLQGTRCTGGGMVNVTCTTRDGKAKTADGDFFDKTEVVTFGATETSKTFTVKLLGDHILEGDEDMYVDLSVLVGCKIGTSGSAKGTIKDRTNGTIMVENTTVDASEPNNFGKFRIRFANPLVKADRTVTVTYSIDASSTATAADYQISPTSVSPIAIPAFANGVDVVIEPKDNFKVEGNNRTVILKIESAN